MAGRPGHRETVADIDLVARTMDAIRPSAGRAFLVSHYHRPQPGVAKGIVQLVDPVTRLRIDIFVNQTGSMSRAAPMTVSGVVLLVLDAEALLDHKLQTIGKASEAHPVDEKHWRDAVALAALVGREPAPRPGYTARDAYSTDLAFVCARCELSRTAAFPLAPKDEIFAVLGYV